MAWEFPIFHGKRNFIKMGLMDEEDHEILSPLNLLTWYEGDKRSGRLVRRSKSVEVNEKNQTIWLFLHRIVRARMIKGYPPSPSFESLYLWTSDIGNVGLIDPSKWWDYRSLNVCEAKGQKKERPKIIIPLPQSIQTIPPQENDECEKEQRKFNELPQAEKDRIIMERQREREEAQKGEISDIYGIASGDVELKKEGE